MLGQEVVCEDSTCGSGSSYGHGRIVDTDLDDDCRISRALLPTPETPLLSLDKPFSSLFQATNLSNVRHVQAERDSSAESALSLWEVFSPFWEVFVLAVRDPGIAWKLLPHLGNICRELLLILGLLRDRAFQVRDAAVVQVNDRQREEIATALIEDQYKLSGDSFSVENAHRPYDKSFAYTHEDGKHGLSESRPRFGKVEKDKSSRATKADADKSVRPGVGGHDEAQGGDLFDSWIKPLFGKKKGGGGPPLKTPLASPLLAPSSAPHSLAKPKAPEKAPEADYSRLNQQKKPVEDLARGFDMGRLDRSPSVATRRMAHQAQLVSLRASVVFLLGVPLTLVALITSVLGLLIAAVLVCCLGVLALLLMICGLVLSLLASLASPVVLPLFNRFWARGRRRDLSSAMAYQSEHLQLYKQEMVPVKKMD